jgi:ComF family protein
MLKNCFSIVQQWFFPSLCVLCGIQAKRHLALCEPCEKELPWLGNTCPYCALPVGEKGSICGQCLQGHPPFTQSHALFSYQSPIDKLITGLKFHERFIYGNLLSELLINKIQHEWYLQQPLPECIIPVPLHPYRLQERGFNQALVIARPLAKKLNIALDFKSCMRIRATDAQMQLPAQQRAKNMKQAFAVKQTLKSRHAAIIDDVVTTGHTVTELTLALRKAGVERIDIWSCARTLI